MEEVYAALLLHSAGKPVEEGAVKKVLEAAGLHTEEAKVKALVSSLKEVNIEEAISKSVITAAAPATAVEGKKAEEKKEEKKQEEAVEGLAGLFG